MPGAEIRNPTAGLDLGTFSSKMIVLWPFIFDQGVFPELTGWVLCDGTNGTPDMRGYFARGTPSGGCSILQQGFGCPECASAIGGCSTHTHALGTTKVFDDCTDFDRCLFVVTSINPAANIPLFKNFNFIMKL